MRKSLTFTNTRVLSASPEQILTALGEKEILANWWGSEGFSSVIHEFDFKTGGTIIYFSCGDCAATGELAVQAGGKMQLEKMDIGEYGFISLVYDTEGNLIGLHSME